VTELAGRRAIVTGASSGIGAATARSLAKLGARVVLVGRDRARLEAVRADCPGAEAVALDVRDAASVERELAPLGADLAVLGAGLAFGAESVVQGDPGEWRTVIETNVLGVLHVARAVLPAMLERGRGDLVLLGSVAGRQVYPGGTVYCASKHAVRALYEGLRLDCAGSGVRFATVDPGMVETNFSTVRFRGDLERAAAVYKGVTPLTAEDVAEAVAWIVTRPPHVNVGELVLWATAQASTTVVRRR
jgi:NADP-dependent 3-hydroxy acid dehydrogenase YdfG